MNNPIVIKTVNENVRPLNERLRRQLVTLREFLLSWDADIEPLLNGVADAVVIEDGRSDVPTRTVGELRNWISLMRFMDILAEHRGNVDQNQLQNAFNTFQNANINAATSLVKFTVRSNIFGD